MARLKPFENDRFFAKEIKRLKETYNPNWSFRNWGYRRFARYFRNKGYDVNEKRIYRIMQWHNLLGKFPPPKNNKRVYPEFTDRKIIILLRALRKFKVERSYTWIEIAQNLGVSVRTIERWNKNKTIAPPIRLNTLRRIQVLLHDKRFSVRYY